MVRLVGEAERRVNVMFRFHLKCTSYESTERHREQLSRTPEETLRPIVLHLRVVRMW